MRTSMRNWSTNTGIPTTNITSIHTHPPTRLASYTATGIITVACAMRTRIIPTCIINTGIRPDWWW